MPIRLEIVSDESDQPIMVALVHLQTGILKVMAEVIWENDRLLLDGLHCHGVGLGPNDLGFPALRRVLREVLDELGLEEAVVSGAIRTTGAAPGRLPRPLRISRNPGPARGRP